MIDNWIQLGYLVSVVLLLVGWRALATPRRATRGALSIAGCVGVAVLSTIFTLESVGDVVPAVLTVLVGIALGAVIAQRAGTLTVDVTLAAFLGVAGLSSVLLAVAWAIAAPDEVSPWQFVAIAIALVTGAFAGLGGLRWAITGQHAATNRAHIHAVSAFLGASVAIAATALGFVADQPVVIIASAVAAALGLAIAHRQARSQGRQLWSVLGWTAGWGTNDAAQTTQRGSVRAVAAADAAMSLIQAHRLLVVPGYGVALTQTHRTLNELVEQLGSRGIEVSYGVHPVAGRIPGHISMLLDELSVASERRIDVTDAYADRDNYDVVLVVGANDIVNFAALTDTDSALAGFPVFKAGDSAQVVVLNLNTEPGFAGIENPFFGAPRTSILLGDLGETVPDLLRAVVRQ